MHAVDGRGAISATKGPNDRGLYGPSFAASRGLFRRRGRRRDRAAAKMWRRAMLLALLVRCRSAHGPMLAVCGRRRSSGAGRRRPWRQKQSAFSGWAQIHLRRRSIVCWSLMPMAPDRRSRDDQIHLLASGWCGACAPAERGGPCLCQTADMAARRAERSEHAPARCLTPPVCLAGGKRKCRVPDGI